MGWATRHIAKLKDGNEAQFRPRGHSMTGIVNDGDLVTVAPVEGDLEVGDVVLCKVKGREYLHLIAGKRDDQYLIGNNRGGINGWTARKNIFGKLTSVE